MIDIFIMLRRLRLAVQHERRPEGHRFHYLNSLKLGMLVIFIWVFLTSLLVWLALKAIMGVRVSEEEEESGVDIAECGMEAYPEFVSQ